MMIQEYHSLKNFILVVSIVIDIKDILKINLALKLNVKNKSIFQICYIQNMLLC